MRLQQRSDEVAIRLSILKGKYFDASPEQRLFGAFFIFRFDSLRLNYRTSNRTLVGTGYRFQKQGIDCPRNIIRRTTAFEVKEMKIKNTRIYAAAAIFLALTLIKILMPEFAFGMREEIAMQIDKNIDYTAVVSALSHKINDYSEKWDIDAMVGFREDRLPSPVVSPELSLPSPSPKASDKAAETAPLETEKPVESEEPTVTEPPLESVPSSGTLPFEFAEPLAIVVSSGFGERLHPIDGVNKFHYGLDLAAAHGDLISAFADGTVLVSEYSESYGHYIVIEHDETYQTLYAHCSELLVSAGESVSVGQSIAKVGQSGSATGPHLHLELRKSGECIDPGAFLC